MRVAIPGATRLIGSHCPPQALAAGHVHGAAEERRRRREAAREPGERGARLVPAKPRLERQRRLRRVVVDRPRAVVNSPGQPCRIPTFGPPPRPTPPAGPLAGPV